jgi:MOSC domain-containing protein YiiM
MVKKLLIKKVKGEPPVEVDSLDISALNGITGDIHSGSDDRAVCLITEKTASEIEAYADKYNCMKKFSPNLIVSGEHVFSAGETLNIGTTVLEITSIGRECHGLCDIPSCPLIDGIVFACVKQGGKIFIGDTVNYG